MLFFASSDSRRAERDARRRSRNRANKRKRTLFRAAISAFSLLVLGFSLRMLRNIRTTRYTDSRLRIPHRIDDLHDHVEESTRNAMNATDVSHALRTQNTVSSTGQDNRPTALQASKFAQKVEKVSTDPEGSRIYMQNQEGQDTASSQPLSQGTLSALTIAQEEGLSKSPQAPGLLAPAIDPSVETISTRVERETPQQKRISREIDNTKQDADSVTVNVDKKSAKDMRIETADLQNVKDTKEDDGITEDKGTSEDEGDEATDTEERQTDKDAQEDATGAEDGETTEDGNGEGGDVILDSIDEEEGGKGLVITLPRKDRSERNAAESDEDNEQGEENNSAEDAGY